jgi:hypothetical protein
VGGVNELDARERALDAFDELLGPPGATLRKLLPTVPWRQAIPPSFWYSPDVLALLDDAGRRELYQRLAEVLGEEHAAALLEFLPPVPCRVLEQRGIHLPLADQ